MRIAIVDWYYQTALDHLYRRTELERAPYDAQLDAVLGLCFGTADAYSVHLRGLGHEAFDIVMNCAPLQRQWAVEHGSARLARLLPLPRRGTPRKAATFLLGRRVLLEQIDAIDPDVVFMQRPEMLFRADLARLRKQGRLLAGHFGGAAPPWRRLSDYDLLVTNKPGLVGPARQRGANIHHLPLGFYESIAHRITTERFDCPAAAPRRDVPIAFIGSVHGQNVAQHGIQRLERLCEAVDLRIWGPLSSDVAADSPIRACHQGEAWGIDTYRLLARTRIAVNRHGDIDRPYACNMRMFEATGMGALVLTEAARNLPPLFQPGREVVTYEDTEDLITKARYYLDHDQERQAVADAGRARTLRDHTYRHRMEELSSLITKQRAIAR